jgi:NAD(P)-dependent dehydrogenase (short-subunit alcohol dehydrogenase family)
MTDSFDVSERVIIVTGGAGLLGREYARALAAERAHVVLADLDSTALEAAVCEVRRSGGSAIGVVTDVASESSVAALVRRTVDEFGRIDGLVNNAALDPKFDRDRRKEHAITFENYPLALWHQALAVNLTGSFLCAREVAPVMRAQERGTIVNISSIYGMVGPDQRLYEQEDSTMPREFKPVAYSVTKSGVIGLTKYLSAYWAGTGIRVNTLTPGGVFNDQPAEFVRRYSARAPLGRMAQRHEYCGALLFLLSDASSYMTGSNLVVDGGWTAW